MEKIGLAQTDIQAMKSIIIARVSTEEQKDAGNSLPAQTVRLRNYCQTKGFEIYKEHSFDESAYKDTRAEFDDILDFIINHNDKLAVCFDKVDRLSRNVFDKRVAVLYEKALKDEVELHFVSDGQIINSQLSAVEKFNFSISLGLAKYYSDAISDNVKRAQEQMLRMGTYPSRPPYGYKRVPVSKDKTEIVVDDFTSQIVQKTYEMYATSSFSMDLLRQKLKKENGINWSKGMIDKVLKDTFYYGEMKWKNKLYSHKYPPLISRSLFEKVQQIKANFNKKPFKYAGKPYRYRGLIRCAKCGLSITPEMKKGHVYYHCTQYNGKHNAEWLREEYITEQLGQVFKQIQIPEEVLNQVIDNLEATHHNKTKFREEQFHRLTTEHETTSKMIEKLYFDKLKECITEDQYDNYYQSLRKKIADIDSQLAMLQDAEDSYYLTAKSLLSLVNRAYDLFIGSEVEERRQLIKLVLQNLRIDGRNVVYEAQKPFDTLLNCTHRQSWLPRVDSDHEPSA